MDSVYDSTDLNQAGIPHGFHSGNPARKRSGRMIAMCSTTVSRKLMAKAVAQKRSQEDRERRNKEKERRQQMQRNIENIRIIKMR